MTYQDEFYGANDHEYRPVIHIRCDGSVTARGITDLRINERHHPLVASISEETAQELSQRFEEIHRASIVDVEREIAQIERAIHDERERYRALLSTYHL